MTKAGLMGRCQAAGSQRLSPWAARVHGGNETAVTAPVVRLSARVRSWSIRSAAAKVKGRRALFAKVSRRIGRRSVGSRRAEDAKGGRMAFLQGAARCRR